MNGSACTVPVPYIAMAARSAVRVQLYGNSATSTADQYTAVQAVSILYLSTAQVAYVEYVRLAALAHAAAVDAEAAKHVPRPRTAFLRMQQL